MNSWFRMYNEVADDPKVQRLSPELFRVWVNLLCIASMSNGVLPCLADVAFRLRMPEESAQACIDQLIVAGLLDADGGDGVDGGGDVIRPHNWDGRQFKSDTSNERTQRYRERLKQRQDSATRDEHVTSHVTSHVTDQNRSDTEQIQNRAEERVSAILPTAKPKRVRRTHTEAFDLFWKSYPKHVGKSAAAKAWTKLQPSDELQRTILTAIDVQKQSSQWCDPRYIPNPATWLNQQRWSDELPQAKPNGNGNGHQAFTGSDFSKDRELFGTGGNKPSDKSSV